MTIWSNKMTEKINIKDNIKNYRIRELHSKILYWEGRKKESDRLIKKYQKELKTLEENKYDL
tara:strand:- start:434 stop:619 length:186 start_codon:yes stop_codon:yes gene_type:complete